MQTRKFLAGVPDPPEPAQLYLAQGFSDVQ